MNKKQQALISALQHFSVGDGPGIRSTVFFQGCNLHCAWCHNPETISTSPCLLFYGAKCRGCGQCVRVCPHGGREDRSLCQACFTCCDQCPGGALQASGKLYTLDEVMAFIEEDLVFYETSGGGVTLSGGEPLLQSEFCLALAKRCREKGIHVLMDTALNVSFSVIEPLLEWVDHWFVDLKAADEETYRQFTGGSLNLTLSNMAQLVQQGASVTARIPLIPGVNATVECCGRMARLLKKTGVTQVAVLPFHRLGSSKYTALGSSYAFAQQEPMTKAEAKEFADVFAAEGLSAEVDG